MKDIDIKKQILVELEKESFPNLKFLYSEEVLDISIYVLREMLLEEKNKFKKLLKTKKEFINFDLFVEKDNLDYFWALLNHLNNIYKNDKIKNIIDEFEQEYIDFGNEIGYNKKLYKMYLYCLDKTVLDLEQKRIIEDSIKNFKLRGIDLSYEKKKKLKSINKKLAKLSQNFSNNIVDDETNYLYIVQDIEHIKELPSTSLENAKILAEQKGLKGYAFNSDPTSYTDILKYCTDKGIRKQIYTDFMNFASRGKYDNRKIILDILKLKKQKANILGYKSYADYNMQKKMADSPKQVFKLISDISKKAIKKAKNEIKDLKKYFNLDHIEPWDLTYYSNKLKEEKYQIDDKQLKKYFEYNKVISYLHKLVFELYSLELRELNQDMYDKDIKLYEVYKDGKFISYYFLDPFYRENKRPGAWADNLRPKYEINGKQVNSIITNVCNFQKSSSGQNLLSIRDVETLFHEFGHALHEMLSESKYSELSGFGVEWDFVELPSQIHENWVGERESLKRFATNCETGETISEELLDRLDSLKTFMSGNFVLRQNEFALLDMYLYTIKVPKSIKELDKVVLDIVNKIGVFKRNSDYKMYTSFSHIFGGGYSAGYYSYMWAEIIEADVFDKIKQLGMFERSTGEKFLQTILGQGCRKDAKDLFFDFMGRDVDDKAFMQRKGFL